MCPAAHNKITHEQSSVRTDRPVHRVFHPQAVAPTVELSHGHHVPWVPILTFVRVFITPIEAEHQHTIVVDAVRQHLQPAPLPHVACHRYCGILGWRHLKHSALGTDVGETGSYLTRR